MSTKLYVGNLSYDVDESALRAFFGNGQNGRLVTRLRMVVDAVTGQRRGFAFVELNGPEQTADALATLNGRTLMGRPVVIRLAHQSQSSRPKPVRVARPSMSLQPMPRQAAMSGTGGKSASR